MRTSKSTLVVLEANAEWPSWLDDEIGLTSFVQGPRESVVDFHNRIERCVECLTSTSSDVVLVCSDPNDTSDESRRSLLVALITHLERGGGGKLALVGGSDYGSRQALSTLALEVSEFLEGLDSSVSCRFRAQPGAASARRPAARAFSVASAAEPAIMPAGRARDVA